MIQLPSHLCFPSPAPFLSSSFSIPPYPTPDVQWGRRGETSRGKTEAGEGETEAQKGKLEA